MGLFDFLTKEGRLKRRIEGARKKVTNMYYQTQDRMAAADVAAELARDGHEEGVLVLLQRFENVASSSTIDQDEKKYVHRLLLGLGDEAVEPVTAYIKRTTNSVYWPLKFMNEQLGDEKFAEFLAKLLEEQEADYVRDPQKKIGLVQLAGDYPSERMYEALKPFVADFDETVRFHAIDGLARSEQKGACDVLAAHLIDDEEESNRCRNRIADALASHDWKAKSRAGDLKDELPSGYAVASSGNVSKRP